MSFSAENAFTLLRCAHEQDRLAHAYLISGPSGSGKRVLVAQLAALVTGAADRALQHPDVHTAEPESKSRRIVTEQVRELEKELQMRPTAGKKKVAVIFEAERMQTQASNAFLKTLEEPPNNSLLLLTSAQPELLPDTILSRCIAVPLTRTSQPELSDLQKQLLGAVRDFFREQKSEAPDLAATYRLIRKFTLLLQGARAQIVDENAAGLKTEETRYKQSTDSKDWLEEREDYYKALTESHYLQQRAGLVETLFQWWADVLRQGQSSATLDLPSYSADTAQLSRKITTLEALKRIGYLEELRENFNRNVKEDLAVEVAFLNAFG
jgi:DNA polymerase-3 subunit delta'